MGKAIITRKANLYTIDEGYAVRIIHNADSTESYDLIPASDGGSIHVVGYRVVTTLNGDNTETVNLVPVGTGEAIETLTFAGLLISEYTDNIFKYTGGTTEDYEQNAYYQIIESIDGSDTIYTAERIHLLPTLDNSATADDISQGKQAYSSDGGVITGTGAAGGLAIVKETESDADAFAIPENNNKFIKYTGETTARYRTNDIYRVQIEEYEIPSDAFNKRPVANESAITILFDATLTPDLSTLIDWTDTDSMLINSSYTVGSSLSMQVLGYPILTYETDMAVLAIRANIEGSSNGYIYQIFNANLSSLYYNGIWDGSPVDAIYNQNLNTDFTEIDWTGWNTQSIIDIYDDYGVDNPGDYVAQSLQPERNSVYNITGVDSSLITALNITISPSNNKFKYLEAFGNMYVDRHNSAVGDSIISLANQLVASLGEDSDTSPLIILVIGGEVYYLVCEQLLDATDNTIVKGHSLTLVEEETAEAISLWSDYTGSDVISQLVLLLGGTSSMVTTGGWNDTYVGVDGRIELGDYSFGYMSEDTGVIPTPEFLDLFSYYSGELRTNLRYNKLPYTSDAITDESDVRLGKVGFDSDGNDFSGALVEGASIDISGDTLDDITEYLDSSNYNTTMTNSVDGSLYRLGRAYEVDDKVSPSYFILPPYGAQTLSSANATRDIINEIHSQVGNWDYTDSISLGGISTLLYAKYLLKSGTDSVVLFKSAATNNLSSDGSIVHQIVTQIFLAGSAAELTSTSSRYNLLGTVKTYGDAVVSNRPLCTFRLDYGSEWYSSAYYYTGDFDTDTNKTNPLGTTLSHNKNFAIKFTNASSQLIRLEAILDTKEDLSDESASYIKYYINNILYKSYLFTTLDDPGFSVTTTTYDTDGTILTSTTENYTSFSNGDTLTTITVDSEITLTVSVTSQGHLLVASNGVDNTNSRIMSLQDAPQGGITGEHGEAGEHPVGELFNHYESGDSISYTNPELSTILAKAVSFVNYDEENSYKSQYTLRQLYEERDFEPKSVNINGTYLATDDDCAAYSQVSVDIPNPIELSTAEEMTAALIESNEGAVFKFTGVTAGLYENGEIYKVISSGGILLMQKLSADTGGDTLEDIIDGTLTSFTMPTGKTKIEQYRFYQFTSLTSANLGAVQEVARYAFDGCTNITGLSLPGSITTIGPYAFRNVSTNGTPFQFIPTNTCSLSVYAFQGSKLSKIKGTFSTFSDYATSSCSSLQEVDIECTSIGAYAVYSNTHLTKIKAVVGAVGSYAFSNNTTLDELNVKIIGSVGTYAFYNLPLLKTATIDKTSNITSLCEYAFSQYMSNRPSPSTNRAEIDLRNSTFTTVQQYTFGGSSSTAANKVKYMDIYLPSSVASVAQYAFRYSDNCNIFFNSASPPTLSATTSWSNATNYTIFVPYNSVIDYRSATNWTAQSTYIRGFAPANTFEVGETLPAMTADDYGIDWFSDIACTVSATVAAADTIYYAVVGAQKLRYTITRVTEIDCAVEISDGTNTYQEGDKVATGTVLTITVAATEEDYIEYLFRVNDVAFTSGSTFTMNQDLKVVALFYDGVNLPVSPTFEDNTWSIIYNTFRDGTANAFWNVGDTKPITLTNGEQHIIRIADMQSGRYELENGLGSSNGVLEFVNCLATAYAMNSSQTNSGGWASCQMRTTRMATIYNLLPSDMQAAISEVKVLSGTGGGTTSGTSSSANKLFLPCEWEIFGAKTYSIGSSEGTPRYDYYTINNTADARIKKIGTSATYWWLRSPCSGNTITFCMVLSDGTATTYNAINSTGVSPCFAI